MPDCSSSVFTYVSKLFYNTDDCFLETKCYDFLVYHNGWKSNGNGTLYMPNIWASLSEDERQCARFLAEEWDYGIENKEEED